MKVVVTHSSPDLDAIASVWLIKKFLPGWEEATVQFVPAGERIGNIKNQKLNIKYQKYIVNIKKRDTVCLGRMRYLSFFPFDILFLICVFDL